MNKERFSIFPWVELRDVESPATQASPMFSLEITQGMCLRLAAFDQLAKEGYDKVVYSDADAVWYRDPRVLFQAPVNYTNRIAAVRDDVHVFDRGLAKAYPTSCREWAHRQSISHDYFNSGVMVVSLKGMYQYLGMLRETSLCDYYRKNQHRYLFADQDALNELGHRRLEMPRSFNAFADYAITPLMTAKEAMVERFNISRCAIIHWTTMSKPWLNHQEPTMLGSVMPHEKYWEAMVPVLEFLDARFVQSVALTLRTYDHLIEHGKRDFKEVGGFDYDAYRDLVR